MKFRTLFVSDHKQFQVPDGWDIHRVDVVTPPRKKPQYMILLTREEIAVDRPNIIGFKTQAIGKRMPLKTKRKRVK